jgi:type II secretory pathway predicted ATPase ExeA
MDWCAEILAQALFLEETMVAPSISSEHVSSVADHFGFREIPFGVAPDPRFFYDHPVYLEGLDALAEGIEAKKGFMLVTGEVGTGKTILLRKLMHHLETTVRFVYVSSTSHLTAHGLIERISQCLDLFGRDKTRLEMIQELNSYLLQQVSDGRTVALLVDEAQKLSDEVLESLGDLSNLETDEQKLLQIALVGQPEVIAKLTKSSLRRIKQRIAIHHQINALSSISEAEDYIRHRLEIASYQGPDIFNKEALEAIWCYSGGTPRLINIICDNALAAAYRAGKRKISAYLIMKVAGNLLLERGINDWRNGSSRNGFSKGKPAPVRINSKIAAIGENVRTTSRPADTQPMELPAEEPVLAAQSMVKEPTVSALVFEQMERAATEAIGPMAKHIVVDQIAALGESRETFPQTRLNELIQRVSEEIFNETMRANFQSTMARQIGARKIIHPL